MAARSGISEIVLVAFGPFTARLTAEQVTDAVALGLESAGVLVDRCPLDGAGEITMSAQLQAVGFDGRMRDARAVVTGAGRLAEQDMAGTLISELATRARQAGVPCHAVVGTREIDAFGARVLDLGVIIEASTPDALQAAGRALAPIVGLPG